MQVLFSDPHWVTLTTFNHVRIPSNSETKQNSAISNSFIQRTSETGFSTFSPRIYRVVFPALLPDTLAAVYLGGQHRQPAGKLWGTHCSWGYSHHAQHNPGPLETGRMHWLTLFWKSNTQFLSGAKQTQCVTTCTVPHLSSSWTAGHDVRVPAAGPEGWASAKLASAGESFAFGCRTNKQINLVQCTKENFEVTFLCSLGYDVLKAQMKNCRSPYLRGKRRSINWSKEFTQHISLQSIVYICKPCSCNLHFCHKHFGNRVEKPRSIQSASQPPGLAALCQSWARAWYPPQSLQQDKEGLGEYSY